MGSQTRGSWTSERRLVRSEQHWTCRLVWRPKTTRLSYSSQVTALGAISWFLTTQTSRPLIRRRFLCRNSPIASRRVRPVHVSLSWTVASVVKLLLVLSTACPWLVLQSLESLTSAVKGALSLPPLGTTRRRWSSDSTASSQQRCSALSRTILVGRTSVSSWRKSPVRYGLRRVARVTTKRPFGPVSSRVVSKYRRCSQGRSSGPSSQALPESGSRAQLRNSLLSLFPSPF